MADRQANINVNYNINTQAVQTAEATVKRAQQTTDQYQKSVGQVGQTWQKTSQQVLSNGQRIASTIDGQRIQMQQLRAQIELTRQSDHKRLAQLTADYKTVKSSVDNFNKSLQVQKQQTETLTQSFNALSLAIRAGVVGGLIYAVKETIGFQLEMAKLAGKVEGVERAFARLPMSTQLLNDLRRATHGTVTDLELMQQALRANNFEIDLKKLGGLLEFAATRAQQTGQEVDYLVNSIVMGIGMKSILRLDNLGLSATRLKEELGGVSVKAASVAEITRVVAKVAEESQNKLGGYFETSDTKVAKLNTKWEEFKVSLSRGVGGSWLTTFLTDVLDTWTVQVEALKQGVSTSEIIIQRLEKERALTWDNAFAKKELGDNIDENIKKVQKEIEEVEKNVNAYAAWQVEIRNLIRQKMAERSQNINDNGLYDKRTLQLSEQITLLREQLEIGTASNGLRKNDIISETEYLRLLRERINALKIEKEDRENQVSELGLIEEYQDRIAELEENITKARKSTNAATREQILIYQKEIDGLQEKVDKLLGTFNEFGTLEVGIDPKNKTKTTQLVKIGATIESFAVPATTMEKLIKDLNEKFKKNPPKIVAEPGSESQWKEAWDAFINGKDGLPTIIASDIIGDQIKSVMQAEVDAYDTRIKAAERFYDRQSELAGEKYSEQTEAEKQRQRELDKIEQDRIKTTDRLRREQAEKEIKARRISVIVDTAAGIARAFATAATTPRAIIQAAIVAAYGASQLAIVNRQRANFATGVIDLKGPGTETSDSIPANLSKGESVMTARETKNSMGILKAIRAKKLDDKVLEQIKSGRAAIASQAFSDKGIIKAIKENKPPDYIEKHGMLYKVYQKEANFRKIQRSKAMGG